MEVPAIEDSFESAECYPSVSERYYKHFYYTSKPDNPPDHSVLMHSNKVCVISLGPKHPIITEKKKVKRLNFQVSDDLDRLSNKVVGKSKKGAQYVKPDSLLCYAECEDGSIYEIVACVKGKLIEVNEQLLKNCNLMVEKPSSDGFIAIILPTKKEYDPSKQSNISLEC